MNIMLAKLGWSRSSRLAIYHAFWIFTDACTVIAAYTLTFLVRTLASFESYLNTLDNIFLFAVLNLIFLQLNGAYKRIWRQTSGREISVLVFASLQTTMVITAINLLPQIRYLPMSVIWMGQFLSMVTFAAFRFRGRLINGLQWRWRAVFLGVFPKDIEATRVLVVGAGHAGQHFVLQTHTLGEKLGLTVVGFIDDDYQKQGLLVEGKPVLGETSDIPRVVHDFQIELIVLAIHNITSTALRRIVDLCQSTEAKIRVIPDLYATLHSSPTSDHLREVRVEDIIGRPAVPIEASQVDMTPITEKVLLVTGAAGSIGSEIAQQLMRYQPRILVLVDNNESGLYDLVNLLKVIDPAMQVVPHLCDVTDEFALGLIFSETRPHVVFHAAAYKHVPLLEDHPYQAVRINVGGTLNTARLAQKYEAERFVLISSDKAVNANNVMGATKYLCEQIVRSLAKAKPECHTLMCAVRFGNVLGSRGSVVPLFEKQIDAGGPITITDRQMSRYFMSIPEAAHLVLQAACMTSGLDLYLLEMGEEVRIVELAERMIRLRGLRPYKDIPIEFVGLRPGETLHEGLILPGEIRRATDHPYIFGVESPVLDAHDFLTHTAHLLNGNLHSKSHHLKAMVIDLAQQSQKQEPVSEKSLAQ